MIKDIIDTTEGRNKAIAQMKHLISILQDEISIADKIMENQERSKIVIGNGVIINSLEIGIRALERLNSHKI